MSATNSTPNYNLPQFVANDKPTFLGDFNKAFLDIDTALKENKTIAETSNTSSDSAKSISETAKNSADLAFNKANENSGKIKNNEENINTINSGINDWKEFDLSEEIKANLEQYKDGSSQNVLFKINYNKKLKLLNCFGYFTGYHIPQSTKVILANLPNGLIPKEDITIYSAGFMQQQIDSSKEEWDNHTISHNGTSIHFSPSEGIYMAGSSFKTGYKNVSLNFMAYLSSARWTL